MPADPGGPGRSDVPIIVAPARDRIQFDFEYEGKRYRPSVKRIPSEANLRRA
ncbi:Arm DNA-binding domain-containing protein [Steroidobacter agaridevorans]|uniref:Arm DNA-binding domain-containing protein n=1 Tax=Steroidobacter agaridevorans TaxID=2695856 RepID=UPI001325B343|nr:DUF3596 domain-containing protein [Steroidobacter agaridevorans]GFE91711.1 hypothetical protein GCM10011488_66650 [Steroidobacter agaridevorans]